jgi:hypothetical protein
MKPTTMQRVGLILATAVSAAGLAILPASAAATAKGAASTTTTAANQARLELIINRGNNEITRRLSSLQTLSSKISSATELTASDQASLSSEVSNEISGLTTLKSSLDADTTVANAITDAQSIISDYRVYALIVPKVNLVKTADDQQVAEGKLSALVPKLQSRISTAQSDGKDVTSLQSGLTDMTNKISAAQGISSQIESAVIGLQPSDYNSDHTILSGDRDQLKTAQNDIQGAVSDATTIVNGLKNL